MAKYKQITTVFNYRTAISAGQIGQRSFVNRLNLKEKLSNEVLDDGLLIISGYSSIGKTSLINLATARRQLQIVNAPFTAVISVLVDNLDDGGILRGIYDEIYEYTSGNKLNKLTPSSIAKAIHTNRLLLIIDGVNSLYDQPSSSKALFNLCKTWNDIPRGMETQSKIILVASGLADWVTQWLNQAGSGTRLPREHIYLPPWDSKDLLKIVEIGSQHLGIKFDDDLQMWMTKVACGLPSTMTLLAHLSSRRANNEQDRVLHEKNMVVDLSDFYGVFGESRKFHQVLHHNESINTLSVSALLVLYILGINNGSISEDEAHKHLELYGFSKDDVSEELGDLIFITKKDETTIWNINELSYGTFAFLRLYHRSKLSVSDAGEIAKILNLINKSGFIQSEHQTNYTSGLSETSKGEYKMLTPEQQAAAWVILQKAFTLVANELKQRWQLAREKKAKQSETSKDGQIQPNVSIPLQTALKTKIENMRDTSQFGMITDDLETAITMVEKYNRRRNKYRKQLPDAMDPVLIEAQIEKFETERDKAIAEIKTVFEKLTEEEVIIIEDEVKK